MSLLEYITQAQVCFLGLGSRDGHSDSPHRIGRAWVEWLADQTQAVGVPIRIEAFQALAGINGTAASGTIGSLSVCLIVPTTPTNTVGSVVHQLLDYGLTPERLVVVHDDCDLEPGRHRLAIRRLSSLGGHNGLRSLTAALDTDQIVRLRLGVGRVQSSVDSFFQDAHPQIETIRAVFPAALHSWLSDRNVKTRLAENRQALSDQWNVYLEQGGRTTVTQLTEQVGRAAGGLSEHPIFIHANTERSIRTLVHFLVQVIRRANARYNSALAAGHLTDPIVQLLERGCPDRLIRAARATQLLPQHFRVDCHLETADGVDRPKLIELNAAGGGLGLDTDSHRLFTGLPVLADQRCLSQPPGPLILNHGFGLSTATAPRRFAFLRQAGPHVIGPENNRLLADLVEAAGSQTARDLTADELTFNGQHLIARGQAVDMLVALTNYGVDERIAGVLSDPVLEAIEAGSLTLFPSPRNLLFASKGFLAALSTADDRLVLGVEPGEWRKVRGFVPWCRCWDAEVADTVTEMRQAGLGFVRKPYFGSGGRRVDILSPLHSLAVPTGATKTADHTVAQIFVPPPTHPCSAGLNFDLLVSVYTEDSRQHLSIFSRVFRGPKASGTSAPVFLID